MTERGVVVVGAGLAGLACAVHLHRAGVTVKIFESGDSVGGRVRTDDVQGFHLDRGFQVLLTAYPEARGLLDYDGLDLRPFVPGALVRTDGRFARVGDPLRRPRDLPATLLAPVGTARDKLRMLSLRRSVCAPPLEELWERPEIPTARALTERYGFSQKMVARFLRPFLAGVLLDGDLQASSRAFEFYFRMFASGAAAIPAGGMEEIPRQLAAMLPEHAVRLNTRVRAADAGGVSLETGERVEAAAVVLAVEAPELAYLVDGFRAPAGCSTTCLYYATDRPPHDEAILVLDGEGTGPVNHLVVPTALSSRLAPAGMHLVSASVLGSPALSDADLDGRVRDQMRAWYGDEVSRWQLLKVYRVLHALPAQAPPALSPPRRPARLAGGLYVCGDHRTNASIDGALLSGRLAAEAVLTDRA